MKRRLVSLSMALFAIGANAQSVGVGTTTPDASAILDVWGTTGGLLVPRLTQAQRDAIASPAKGLLIFNTDSNFQSFDGVWKHLVLYNNGSVQFAGNASANHYIGFEAGLSNTTGFENYFSGYSAGKSNTTGFKNHFSGFNAGRENVSGFRNTFIGYSCGLLNTSGVENTFIGYRAGENSTADDCTFIGYMAGWRGNTGNNNVFVGVSAGVNALTGANNSFFGAYAGAGNQTGAYNYFGGFNAGSTNLTGSGNTLLGANADVATPSLTNAGAIGYNAKVSQSNSIVIGGTGADAVKVGIGVTAPTITLQVNGVVGGVGPFLNLSDSRLKKNILPVTNALSGILQLQPVSYDWKKETYPQFNFDDKRQIGFLAQELEKIFPEAVTKGADGFYTIAYSELIPILVQGMKEQQAQADEMKEEIRQLKNAIRVLTTKIETSQK